eukprot:Opistho-1_new@6250
MCLSVRACVHVVRCVPCIGWNEKARCPGGGRALDGRGRRRLAGAWNPVACRRAAALSRSALCLRAFGRCLNLRAQSYIMMVSGIAAHVWKSGEFVRAYIDFTQKGKASRKPHVGLSENNTGTLHS